MDCAESVDCFGQYGHFNNINSSNPWTSGIILLIPVSHVNVLWISVYRSFTDKSKHSCPVPEIREKAFSFSPLSMMLAVGLSYMTFVICWGTFLLNLICWEFLSWCCICQMLFLYLLRWQMIIWFLSLTLNLVYQIYWFVCVESSLYHRDITLLMCC